MAFQRYKGGRKDAHPDFVRPRLWLDDFLTNVPVGVKAVPDATSLIVQDVDWCTAVQNELPMDLNDELGDCGIAGMDHWQVAANTYAGHSAASWGNGLCLSLYEHLGGYVQGDPSTDNGTVLQDNLSFWQHEGVPLANGQTDKILFYGAIRNYTSRTVRVQALKALGPLYTGIQCPQSAEQQFAGGQPWTLVKGSPNAGGHCTVQLAEFHSLNEIREATWGGVAKANQAFYNATTVEVWAIGGADFIERNGMNPSGLDVDGMNEALAALTGRSNPLGLRRIL